MRRFRALWFACAIVLPIFEVLVFTQTPTTPTFEVASIKPNNSGMPGVLVYPQAGLLRSVNFSLAALIQSAYGVAVDQVVGGPDWVRTLRFDVMAKTPNDQAVVWQGPNSVRPLLQALLQERFKLAVHHETRSLPNMHWSWHAQMDDSGHSCAAARRTAQPSILRNRSKP